MNWNSVEVVPRNFLDCYYTFDFYFLTVVLRYVNNSSCFPYKKYCSGSNSKVNNIYISTINLESSLCVFFRSRLVAVATQSLISAKQMNLRILKRAK